MLCNKFSELTTREKVLFIGELTHACMNDDDLYEKGIEIIKVATAKGLFDNVKIMPDHKNDTEN
jgi:hypothetical protein